MDCPDVSRVFKGRALFCEKVKKSAKILAGEEGETACSPAGNVLLLAKLAVFVFASALNIFPTSIARRHQSVNARASASVPQPYPSV
jgi:hypothetical protein